MMLVSSALLATIGLAEQVSKQMSSFEFQGTTTDHTQHLAQNGLNSNISQVPVQVLRI